MARKLILVASLLLTLFVFTTTLTSAQGNAQIRFGHFAAGAPNVDVFLNGVWMLEDYEPEWISGLIDVQSGNLDVEIAPAGEDGNNPLITADGLQLEAGHRYSLALIGTADDLSTLLIDDTEETAGCDMSKSVFRIIVNNIANSPPVSFYEGDRWLEENVAYGTYSAACFPAFFADTGWAYAGSDFDQQMFNFDDETDGFGTMWEPYTLYFEGMMGDYFGDYYFSESRTYNTAPDPLAFLAAFTGLSMTYDSEVYFEFEHVLEEIERAGLNDLLLQEGDYTLFVPTDQAFAGLSKRDQAQLSDPDTLRDVLLYHMLEDNWTYDELVDAETVETMQGAELEITVDPDDEDQYYFFLNDEAQVENYAYVMENGWRLYFISNYSVLFPNGGGKSAG